MAITVTVAPTTTQLTTLDRVRAELSITDTSSDALLTDLISDASSAIAVECGWSFGVATYVETFKGDNSQYQHLSRAPLVVITAVLEDGAAITDWLIEDASTGALYRDAGWGRTAGALMWGWEAMSSGYILPGGNATQRYQVTYQAGYTLPANLPIAVPSVPPAPPDPPPLPGAVQRACIATIRDWWFTKDRDVSVASTRVDDIAVTYAASAVQTGNLPAQALALLANYKKRT
jgi:hypothetical protein